jgi:outer membrane protein assembly factor BamA
MKVAFEAPEGTPGLPDFEKESDLGCVVPSLTFDSRDNIFTPTSGTYVDASAALFGKALGGDTDFERVQVTAIEYVHLLPRLYLGLRGDYMACYGDAPFYLAPFVDMRGVSAMRYQGDDVLQIEAELRWQFWKRFSLLGFGGYGEARADIERSDLAEVVRFKDVEMGGFGFRYELARKYGIHAGVDVAFGPDDVAIYFQTGSAWARP